MSEKELELMERLIDMLGGAGEGAFWLAIAWIGQGYFKPVAAGAILLVMAYLLYRAVIRISGSAGHWDELRLEAGCRSPYGYVMESERQRVFDMIRKGVEAERKERTNDT